MFADFMALLWPGNHPQLLGRRRAEAILVRARAFATLFAVLTAAWIALDVLLVEGRRLDLAMARTAATAAFVTLAIGCRGAEPTLVHARLALLALYAIPVGLFIVSQRAFETSALQGLAQGFGSVYAFVPFLLACGIAAFPLTAAEALAVAVLPFAAQIWFIGLYSSRLPGLVAFDAFWLLMVATAMAGFAAMSQVKLMTALVHQAIRDPLTGCLRRESGEELLGLQLALAARQEAPLAVLFADIDHFKDVNDTFGHEVGDQVLANTAEALRAPLRDSDAVLRWGGEEFVVVLPLATKAEAVRLIERLRARGFGRDRHGRAVTVSIGIAEYREDMVDNVPALIELADARMYQAKQAGRNRYVRGPHADAVPIIV